MKDFKLSNMINKWILVVILIFFWETFPHFYPNVEYVLPRLSTIISSALNLLLNGRIFIDIVVSLYRIFLGFGVAVLIAIPLGFLMGEYKFVERMLNPIVEMFRPLSPIALFPLFILFFGIGLMSKVAIIFWVCLFPLLLNTIKGVKSVDTLLIDAAHSMGANKFEIFMSVVIPHSLYWIVTGLRISFSSAFLALIAAEMIGSSNGLGYFVLHSAQTFRISEMYVGIIIIAILGFAFNCIFIRLETRFSLWRTK